tara:strand:+ start:909 stop:1067 length:159 start_codon:yes stop_codon:yes gene_type:complete
MSNLVFKYNQISDDSFKCFLQILQTYKVLARSCFGGLKPKGGSNYNQRGWQG